MMAYFFETSKAVWPEQVHSGRLPFLIRTEGIMAEIKFTSKEHENFYKEMLQKSGNSDSYHRAFFYCIGISNTTRRNAGRIFDFEQDRIKPDGLHEG